MQLRRLELVDWRSYEQAGVSLEGGVTVFVGANAQGKTNLLEAVHRLAIGSSHRVATDAALVRMGADTAVVRAELRTDGDRRRTVELEFSPGRRGRVRVDGQDVRRAADALGVVRVVLFAPEDLAIVRGDPTERRRFLDELLAQRRPTFAAARGEYERALRQRNQLLKQLRVRGGADAAASLEAWTEQLVYLGAQIVAARIAAVRSLAGPLDEGYRELADRPEPVRVAYRSSAGAEVADTGGSLVPDPAPIAEALRSAFGRLRDEEIARAVTLVGPHRDDLELTIGTLPARGYASHGEAWSLALAIKLATYGVLADVGDRPVVLLDDVFAELDETRRTRLADACVRFDQVLVTAAVEADVPLGGHRVDVTLHDGVSRVAPRTSTGQEAS